MSPKKRQPIADGYVDLAGKWHPTAGAPEGEVASKKGRGKHFPYDPVFDTPPSRYTPGEKLAQKQAFLERLLARWEQWEADGTLDRWPSIRKNWSDFIVEAERDVEIFRETHGL